MDARQAAIKAEQEHRQLIGSIVKMGKTIAALEGVIETLSEKVDGLIEASDIKTLSEKVDGLIEAKAVSPSESKIKKST